MTMTFGLIFPMGSDMDKYYCLFDSTGIIEARHQAEALYPNRILTVLPADDRFFAHVKIYQKSQIAFGAKVTHPPTISNDLSLDRA